MTVKLLEFLLVAEFGTDHIEKAVFVTSASFFLETVGGMKLKFGEEIEKNLFIKIRRHSGEIFSIFALIPVLSGGGRGGRG